MRRSLALAGLTLLWLGLSATEVSAHAVLRSSAPEDGALVEAPPAEVVMRFSEPPDLGLSRVEVVDASGATVETGSLERAGSDREVRVALPTDLAEGVYTVSWRVLSTVDGHVTAGSFTFGAGVEAGSVVPSGGEAGEVEAPQPTPLSVGGRWAFYWGLALLLGGALAGTVVFRRPLRGGFLLLGVAWLVALVGLVGMLVAEAGEAAIGVGDLLASDRGELLILRAGALGAAGGGALAAALLRRRAAFVLLGLATAGAMLVHAYAGHAGAAESARWVKVGVQWLHIVGVGAWIGGLAWLLLGLVAGDGDEEGGIERPAVGRFSRLAVGALGVVALTGFLRAWSEVGSVGRLFDSGFGLAAAGKSVLFLGLLGLGAYNRRRVVPRVQTAGERVGTLRRTVTSELLIAAAVFGLSGVMAGLVPPATVLAAGRAQEPPEQVVVTGSDFATTLRVRLAAAPGTPGPNTFQVELSDYDTGKPAEAEGVTLRFSFPARPEVETTELDLERMETGRWRGQGTNLSVEGTWTVGVLVRQADDSRQVDLELRTRPVEPQIEVIEGGPGVPDLYNIALAGGRSAQAYVDPGEAGSNEVHFTFFDAEGSELPIEEATILAAPEDGDPIDGEARRLSPGHFVAGVDLDAGRWEFSVEASTEDGMVLTAAFEEEL